MKGLELLAVNLAKLVDVKTIISLTMVFTLVYGFANGLVGGELFAGFAGSIFTYFFTRKDA